MTQPSVSGSSFQIAQASGSAAPQAPRKAVVTRPADGQSVVIDVRGGAEIDLRGIAADRVVFVQVGDRLVILFENREAVVLQGFYRDGEVAQDLVFQVADGQQVGPQQFASLFPITSDLTILPASGPGSASGGANTAKNVTDPSFGPSGGQRNGLDLLGNTDGGDGLPPPGGPLDGRPSVAALQISVLIDEDGESFKGGIESGNEGGNDDLEGAPTFFTGRLIYDFGTDGPSAKVPISFNVAGLPAATSLGEPVVYQWSQSTLTLTASADGKPVFTLTINNIFTGEFTFTLFQPLDHPDGQNPGFEDEIVFSFPFTIADSDGDTASGSFTVTVDDDTPVIGRGEDTGEGATGGQPGTVEDEAVNEGNNEEEDPDLSATADGSLNIRWGADNGDNREEADEGNEEFEVGDRNVAFTDSSVAVSGGFFSGSEKPEEGDEPVLGLNRLTSLGRDVLTTLVGGVLVGYVGAEPPVGLDSKGIVFTVSLSDNGSGSYTFTLVQPLDHAAEEGENNLTLTFGYTATDSDGDKVSSTFTVTVQDDVPMIAGGEGSGDPSVVEDEAVNGGNQEEAPDTDLAGNVISGSSTGSLVIQWGADNGDASAETDEGNETFQVGDRNVAFTNANLELAGGFGEGLTSLGSAVSTVLIAGVLVGYVGTQPTSFDPEAPAAGTVFFVQLSDNNSGSYTFNLVQPLDHAAGGGENELTLTFGYTATDSDGDKASSTFTVTVKDDEVTIGKPERGDVDEDGLIPLRGNPFGSGDTTQLDGSTTTKSLDISWGSDNANDGNGQPGDRSVAFAEGLTAPAGLTSDTLAVTYSFNEDRTVLTAFTTAGTVFTVTLSDVDGTYRFDLVGTLDHRVANTEDNIDLTFDFVATDSDGDTAASSFAVSVDDDTPLVILPLNSSVDEDGPLPIITGLPGSNPLGNGDNLIALTTATNILGISWGADNNNPTTGTGYSLGDRAVTFATDLTAPANLTSDGLAVTYSFNDDRTVLTASTTAGTVFTVSLSDQGPLGVGSYTFTLLNNLDHPGPNTEDNINLTFGFVATDSDGDTATSSFTVSVDDDTPLVILPLNSTVDEDGPLPIITGLPGSNPLGNGDNLIALTTATNILGISWGADNNNPTTGTGYSLGDRAVTFATDLTAPANLTSDGLAVTYSFNDDRTVLTASTTAGTVFTVSLSDQGPLGVGSYTFTLLNNLDHPGPNTEDNINLTFGFVATDSDGDTATSSFTVSVDDDTPLVILPLNSTVDEDGPLPIVTGLPGSNPLGNGDNLIALTTATNILGISWGADNNNPTTGTGYSLGDRAVTFATDLTAPANLTSDGLAVTYSFNDDRTVLTASTTAGTVFTVSLSDQGPLGVGSYTFTLLNNLDHPGPNTEDNINLTFGFVATDSDGDTATSSFTVSVDDDTPLVILPLNSTVDEDGPLPIVTGLPGSNPLGNGDNLIALTTATNILGISWGADNNNPTTGTGYSLGDRAVTFGESTVSDLAARGLTSDGHPIQYEVSEGGSLLTAFTDVGGRVTVFTVSLSDQGPLGVGSYTFTLLNNLDHPGPNTEDNIDLTFGFVATDSDGDTATSSFTVSVDDDTPLVILPLNSTVDEDGILPGAPALGLGNPGGPGDSLLSLTSATSLLGISWGADSNNPTSGTGYSLGDRSVTFASTLLATLNGLQLTSGGAALKYEISPSGTTLTAYTGATSADGQVFTVSLSDADLATYTFNLLDNLDHGVANTEDNIDLTFDFVATDSDGDTAASSFTVSVNDDSPVILPQLIGGFADEDGPLLNPGAGLPGSNPGPVLSEPGTALLATTSANGGLGIVWGADSHNVATDNAYVKGDRAATFATAVNTTEAANTTIATLQALNLKSGGVALTFSMNAAGTELVAHTGATPDQGRVFEVKLSDSGNGSYAFKLLGPLDHAEGAGENDLVLNFRFVATDSDGDTAASQFTVTVNDDSPTDSGQSSYREPRRCQLHG
jgi:large repetitive protein